MAHVNFDDIADDYSFEYKGETYRLQATAGSVRQYQNFQSSQVKTNASGIATSFGNVGDYVPKLVSLCYVDESNKRVKDAVVDSWPPSMVQTLFEKAQEATGLNKADDSISDLIKKALAEEGSPISYDAFSEFILGLDESYQALQLIVRSGEDELKK